MFDMDALTAAMEAPSFKWDGTTYTGRLMGYLDFLKWAGELDRVSRDTATTESDIARILRGVLASMQFSETAADALLGSAPRPLVQQVLNHFFKLHRPTKAEPAVEPVAP